MGAFLETLKAKAPLSVAGYMALCNAHYYATRDPFGQTGDFITAPEISQIFGEVIGAFIKHVAADEVFTLIEAGPGRGTLMADVTRVAQPQEIGLVETSSLLIEKQREKLSGKNVSWKNSLGDIASATPNVLLFNEFFDALPIEQTIKGHRRQIVLKDGALAFDAYGVIEESSPARNAVMAQACALLKNGGMAIVVDYGPFQWGEGETLQAVAKHQFVHPLETPGEADLTSHVDFNALASVAEEAGLYVHPLMTQGEFLTRLGGGIRAAKLGKESDYDRLVNPKQMGRLFKVMIVCHPSWQERVQEALP